MVSVVRVKGAERLGDGAAAVGALKTLACGGERIHLIDSYN